MEIGYCRVTTNGSIGKAWTVYYGSDEPPPDLSAITEERLNDIAAAHIARTGRIPHVIRLPMGELRQPLGEDEIIVRTPPRIADMAIGETYPIIEGQSQRMWVRLPPAGDGKK